MSWGQLTQYNSTFWHAVFLKHLNSYKDGMSDDDNDDDFEENFESEGEESENER